MKRTPLVSSVLALHTPAWADPIDPMPGEVRELIVERLQTTAPDMTVDADVTAPLEGFNGEDRMSRRQSGLGVGITTVIQNFECTRIA